VVLSNCLAAVNGGHPDFFFREVRAAQNVGKRLRIVVHWPMREAGPGLGINGHLDALRASVPF